MKEGRQRKILVRQCSNVADGRSRWEAYAYLLSLPSYPLSWPRYCGVRKLRLYSTTEGEHAHAKGTTNIHERVQAGSRALSEKQWQEYQPGGTRTGHRREYAASVVS